MTVAFHIEKKIHPLTPSMGTRPQTYISLGLNMVILIYNYNL